MRRPVVKLCWTLLLASGPVAWAQQYTISTVAGGAPPTTPATALGTSIGQPRKLTVTSAGVYFSSGNSVFKLDGSGNLALVAGNSRAGFSGDGSPAVSAQLNAPQGVAVDSAGNVYIADSLNNRVRVVNPQGVITTFAGNGSTAAPNFWGDGGPATDANLHLPTGVAVDSSGNVYIAAASDNTVRIVTTDGIINIFAGSGFAGYYGDQSAVGTAAATAVIGTATVAGLHGPQDVALGPGGAIYIADTGNAVIRMVAGGIITTVAGTGAVGLAGDGGLATSSAMSAPYSVAVDSSGNMVIADYGNNRIRKVDKTSGNISTIAGTGNIGFAGDGSVATGAILHLPTGVALDSSGNVYVADSLNNRIRKIAGSNIATVAGNGGLSSSGDSGPATSAQLNTPLGVAVDGAGNIYIADSLNNTIRRVSAGGTISTFAGNSVPGNSGDGGAPTSAQLNGPQGVAVDGAGNLYIADTQNHKVRIVSGGVIGTFAGSGTAGFSGDGGAAAAASLNAPFGVAVDAAGNVYIAEFSNNRVRKVDTKGIITTVAGTGVSGYGGDGAAATGALLNGPQSVAVDAAGNLYIADTANNRLRKVTPGGTIGTIGGNGLAGFAADGVQAAGTHVGNPTGVAVDTFGNVYVADGNARVRKIYPSGIIATIAGNGARGYSGDGGAGTGARLSAPSAVAVNAAGNVYVADTLNNAVRLLQVGGFGITVTAVVNAASSQSGPVAPGELIVIYGTGLGPDQVTLSQASSSGFVPANVAGTSVLIDGALAPIIYTSANQVAVVVPFVTGGSLAQLFVQYQGQSSAGFNLSVASVTPGLFTLNGAGTGQAAAVNEGGSLNGPAKPVKAGDFVSLYMTGAGQTNPGGTDGHLAAVPLPLPLLKVTVSIGG
ncbi:MAG TPA: IPT/TIG domain-containing protein, partial [Candidatus Solibacter sp.]|nr:IPT/TIG domain-containing protein [Candidatus Solibacter sp.]